MSIEDLVAFKPKIVKLISEEETIRAFQDNNLMMVLSYLRDKPATVSDIVEHFKENELDKSESSIYRYIQKLIRVDLVAKAGKRITSINATDMKSETLYCRTAKVFMHSYTMVEMETPDGDKICKLAHISRLLLQNLFPNHTGSSKCFSDFMDNLERDKKELLADLIDNADEETLELFEGLHFEYLTFIFETTGWLGLLLKQKDILEQAKSCLTKD